MKKAYWTLWGAIVVFAAGCATTKTAVTDHAGKPDTKPVKTGVYVSKGLSGGGAIEWIRLVHDSPELELTLLDSEAIRAGALDKLDMLVMPGGSSPSIKRDLGTNGAARIKAFLRNGGGYIGTCAGCCLMMEEAPDPSRGLNVMPFYRSGSKGRFLMPVGVNAKGAEALGVKKGTYWLQYSHGPILEPSTNSIPDANFEVWGTNLSDSGKFGSKLEMYGRAALVGGTYGKGRVVVTSCHPEYLEATRVLLQGAFRHITGRDVTFPVRPRRAKAYNVALLAEAFIGIDVGKVVTALSDDESIDFSAINEEDIRRGLLDHVDALILPDSRYDAIQGSTREIVKRFAARGGYILGWGRGPARMRELCEVCPSSQEAVERLKKRAR
ncbi:MAG: hypothetical protein J5985_02735 [Kiritimatiellae bacterium]|nr:hypothetical protein [Kiritimatiellia bacterium]